MTSAGADAMDDAVTEQEILGTTRRHCPHSVKDLLKVTLYYIFKNMFQIL